MICTVQAFLSCEAKNWLSDAFLKARNKAQIIIFESKLRFFLKATVRSVIYSGIKRITYLSDVKKGTLNTSRIVDQRGLHSNFSKNNTAERS